MTESSVQFGRQWKWRHKLTAAGLSIVVTVIIFRVGAEFYVASLGLHDLRFQYENQIDMWRYDAATGYVNRPNFSAWCHGNVLVRTNSLGFRGESEIDTLKPPGVKRIVGLGDSVMWGVGLDEDETFVHLLGERLSQTQPFEIINAGVVGYSTLQELRLLETAVLPLDPDIVLVNFCENDIMPTEDPFSNARSITAAYVRRIMADEQSLSPSQRPHITRLIEVLEEHASVWGSINIGGWELEEAAFEALVERPMTRMAELADEHTFRLIVLFIPPESGPNVFEYRLQSERLKQVLGNLGVEAVDLREVMNPPGGPSPPIDRTPRWVRRLSEWLLIRPIVNYHRMENRQRQMYFDPVHPSRRACVLIADRLYEYLAD